MATKIFDIEGISKLGTEAVTINEVPSVERALVSFMQKVQKGATENLDKSGANASVSLRQSVIILPVQAYGANYSIELQMNDYWKFVNEGVQGWDAARSKNKTSPFKYRIGKRPPRASIEEWITAKGINPGGRRGERLQPRADLARAMAYNIGRYGTKGNKFLDKALPTELVQAMTNEVAEALGREISISIRL